MRNPPSVIALAAAALLAAGCGSSNSGNTTGSDTSQSSQNFVTQAFAFARCMRSHGAPNYPDPQVQSTGTSTQIRMMVPSSLGNSPGFKTAAQDCKGLAPSPENGNSPQAAAQRRAKQQALLAFAQCLRSHGLPNFPDPTAQGDITPAMLQAAGIDLQSPAVLPAARDCVGVTHGLITLAQVEQAIQRQGASGTGSTGSGSGPSSGSGG